VRLEVAAQGLAWAGKQATCDGRSGMGWWASERSWRGLHGRGCGSVHACV
jgi:hypothetical protein